MPETRTRGRYGRYLRELMLLVDLLLVNALFGILCRIHPEILEHQSRLKWLMVTVSYFPAAWLYGRTRLQRILHMDRLVIEALGAVVVHALVFVTTLSFLKADDMPAAYFVQFYAMMLVALPLTWLLVRAVVKRFRSHGRNFSRVVIVGTNSTARRLYKTLSDDDSYGYRVLGFFDKRPADGFYGNYCGTLDALAGFINREMIDEVFYVLSGENEDELLRCIGIADECMVAFHYVPKISPYSGRRFELDSIGGLPVLTPRPNPLSRSYNEAVKRLFDLAFSSAFLLVSPLLFIPIAIAVKLSSPGPVFFRQKRTGYRGREFECLKFRTMRVNDGADTVQCTASDPRKTRIGDFLRRTSLDELPQFINVWRGDMSVVGPRPHMLAHTEEYRRIIDKYMIRHIVKPGITGWAQVLGLRGSTDLAKMEKRVQADVWYIEHWSAMLDIKIIIKTVINGFRGEENAY